MLARSQLHRCRPLASVAILLGVGLAACDRQLPGTPDTPDTSVDLRIDGRVVDSLGEPIEGVVVSLLSDPAVAVSDAAGAFSLSGRSDQDRAATVRLRRDGYRPHDQYIPALAPGQRLNWSFRLVSESVLDPTGDYDLTVAADSSCDSLPAVARERTFQASVVPTADPAIFDIRLTGAVLSADAIRLDAGTEMVRVFVGVLGLFDEDSLVERLPSGAEVRMYGRAFGRMVPGDAVTVLPLDGFIGYCAAAEVPLCSLGAAPAPFCRGTHQLTLARR